MATSTRLTPLGINKAKAKTADLWMSDDEGTRGGGRLVVRISTSGSKLFYFRYSLNGVRKQIPIGPFAYEETPGKFTLDQARSEARTYSALHRREESKDVVAHLRALDEAKDEERKQEAARRLQQEEVRARESKYSLLALCETYAKHLQTLEKASAADVASLVKLYVKPSDLASLPAKAVQAKQITTLLRAIVDAKKGRTAGKLRSTMRAAYELALKAELDPTTPSEFISFEIESNPVASTAALSKFSKARNRNLSESEMAEVWKRLKNIPKDGPLPALAVRLVVLLGGQRAAQLLRVQIATGIDIDEEVILLLDPKGRREEARIHALPLVDDAVNDVENLIARSLAIGSEWLFAGRKKGHLTANSLSHVVLDISREMIATDASIKPFQFSDLRRTAETMLASIGISKDTRAQLQSHGISGVQARHYDKYEYLTEKQNALTAWHAHLNSLNNDKDKKSNVRRLKIA